MDVTHIAGHGNDVRTVAWHPYKGLLASGSRDTQQPVMLWDPRAEAPLATLSVTPHPLTHPLTHPPTHPLTRALQAAAQEHGDGGALEPERQLAADGRPRPDGPSPHPTPHTHTHTSQIKLYDIRKMRVLQEFRGHHSEVECWLLLARRGVICAAIAWHPVHEELFVSGGADGGRREGPCEAAQCSAAGLHVSRRRCGEISAPEISE